MGQIVQRGVVVEDLENEQMDHVGGSEQSFLPGAVLLAAGGVVPRNAQAWLPSRMQLPSKGPRKKTSWLDLSTCTKQDPHTFGWSQPSRYWMLR